MTKTDWYPGTTKPVRVGMYERTTTRGYLMWSRWDGYYWRIHWHEYEFAKQETLRSGFQELPWRGLTEKVKP